MRYPTAMSNKPSPRLRLRATDAEDLTILSAALQDAIVPVLDISFEPENHRFIAVFNRFKWEAADRGETDDEGNPVYERTHAGLRVEGATAVRRRGIDPKRPGAFLQVLAIRAVEGAVEFDFAGGKAIRVEVPKIDVYLDDMGEAWPSTNRPGHPTEDEADAGSGEAGASEGGVRG